MKSSLVEELLKLNLTHKQRENHDNKYKKEQFNDTVIWLQNTTTRKIKEHTTWGDGEVIPTEET